ncbi:hypothetical protein SAMN05421688_1628 [Poseidonocella pacifica]|uniref:Argininosuccinate lyase n=1 Tax=Poseidonocella pacifica TaxID=871651 RepID=A0A1I0WR47_9RHOB|nr:hypothetical protein [Poseidonocella pacifica]SFA90456.1 hypothetical protein SAMN05421688_1628 [Poseidonocella pacifica]
MRSISLLFILALAACGADGEPTPPRVTGDTTIGVNSKNGGFTRTSIGVEFGSR